MTSRLPLLAALTALFSGCSFVFGGGPPADHQQMPYFDCPSTMGLPVADGFLATGGIIAAATVLNQGKQEYADKNKGQSRNAAAGINIGTAVVFGASAIYGIVQANRCSAAKEQLKARILTPMLSPMPTAQPPTPSLPPPLPAPTPAPTDTAPKETAPPPAATP
jgi:hypothetical protein